MSQFESFRYDDKRVLVVGGATGMGAAAAELVLSGAHPDARPVAELLDGRLG